MLCTVSNSSSATVCTTTPHYTTIRLLPAVITALLLGCFRNRNCFLWSSEALAPRLITSVVPTHPKHCHIQALYNSKMKYSLEQKQKDLNIPSLGILVFKDGNRNISVWL